MLSDKKLTLQEVREWRQYWLSKQCNTSMVEERKTFEDLYNAYTKLEQLYLKLNWE